MDSSLPPQTKSHVMKPDGLFSPSTQNQSSSTTPNTCSASGETMKTPSSIQPKNQMEETPTSMGAIPLEYRHKPSTGTLNSASNNTPSSADTPCSQSSKTVHTAHTPSASEKTSPSTRTSPTLSTMNMPSR